MAGDHQEPTRCKRRRTSSDELDESSKRRRHRHHQRHHHHHHSQKHECKPDDESNCEVGIEIDGGRTPPVAEVESFERWRPDYDDMEEGEILEEEGDAEIRQNNYTVVPEGSFEPNNGSSLHMGDGLATKGTVDMDQNHNKYDKIAVGTDPQRSLSKELPDSWHRGKSDTRKEDNIRHLRSSPEGKGKRKNYYDDENGLRAQSTSLSSENSGKRHKTLGYSPSHENVDEEVHIRNRSREMDRDGDRNRVRDRDRDRYAEKDRESAGDRDRERRKDRDSDRDRNRSTGNDRVSRHNHDVYADCYRQDDYRHRVYETNRRDKSSRGDPENFDNSRNGHPEIEREKLKREEFEEEDCQLHLAEQEEDDLNKIKEESRRRRQAILDKYKTRPQIEDKGKENIGKPSGPVAGAAKSKSLHCLSEGPDTFLCDTSFSVGKSKTSCTGGLGEGTSRSERSNDMFSDDIFGESPAGVQKSGKGDGVAIERSGFHDNWDDAKGYYSYRFGEILDGRYEVIAAHGKGVFSTVVRAKDLKAGPGDPEEVAIKIIRNNHITYKAGLDELIILKKLVGADQEDRRHCVRFLSSFKYHNYLCLVFESLHMNLRQLLNKFGLDKFGRNIGLNITAVREYAKQLFIALKHLRNCGVLHSDIKPDNILVNDAKNVLKLCDFGSAMFAGKNEITPYLVSRYYRAPEIILGLAYGHPLDIWSVGCCLFELYKGEFLFHGDTNHDMLRRHMELKGPFPKRMLQKGKFALRHFDPDLNFLATEEDPVTNKAIKRSILNIKPKGIGSKIISSPGEDRKMLANFKDLLEKIFVLDPNKRITVQQALSHPFITGK